jgi:flavin-dependent dehydrogenase
MTDAEMPNTRSTTADVAIIGGRPGGLTAAYQLTQQGYTA